MQEHPIEDAYWDEIRRTGTPVHGVRHYHIGAHHKVQETDWETWQGDATERTRQLGERAMEHRQRMGAVDPGDDLWRTVSHIGREAGRLTPPRRGQSAKDFKRGQAASSRASSPLAQTDEVDLDVPTPDEEGTSPDEDPLHIRNDDDEVSSSSDRYDCWGKVNKL